MNKVNYKQIFAIQKKNEETIKKLCPEATHTSGIYVFYREQDGFKFAYVGLATKSLLTRMAQHLSGYQQHIDLSIRKYGLFDKIKNPYGYKAGILCFCKKDECNEREQYYIKNLANKGWQMKNTTGGSQGKGKFGISENKQSKGYYDGVAQGKKKLREELNYIIEKYLVISLKKDNKLSQKALTKFNKLLTQEDNNEEEGGE